MRNPPRSDALAGDQPSDDDLAQAALYDPAQYAVLYRRYVSRVYRYFYGRVGNAADAEDLTAQLFMEVLQALPRYRPQGAFTAWLFTLVRRRAADFHRKQRPVLPIEWAEEAAMDSVTGAAYTPGADPLGEVIQAEHMARLGELYARLDEDRQEIIRLHYASGLSYRQVGEVLGRSEAAIAMAMHRALQWFQKNWEVQDA